MRIVLATVAAVAALTTASPAPGSAGPSPARPTVVVKVSRGFDWTAALIGAAAAAGVLVALAGVLQSLKHEREGDQ